MSLLALVLVAAGPPPADDLYAVSSPDGRLVVAVGAHGTIRVSADGGASWQASAAPVDTSLSSVSMADPQHGWAVGMGGSVLRTEDGGATWLRQEPAVGVESPHLLSVHAQDAQRALVVGAWGARWRTTDGGRNWHDDPLSIGPDHPRYAWLDPAERARVRRGGAVREDVTLQSVHCLRGGERCWLVGEFGTILGSTDGGASWRRAVIEAGVAPVEIGFAAGGGRSAAAPEIGALATALAEFPSAVLEVAARVGPAELRSLAGGSAASLPGRLEERLEAARAELEISGIDSDRIRVLLPPTREWGDFSGGAGPLRAWLEARRADRPGVRVTLRLRPLLYDVAFADAERGVAVGLGGVVLHSRDGGLHWRPASTRAGAALYAVAVRGQGTLAVGQGGRLWSAGAADSRELLPGSGPRIGFLRDLAWTEGLVVAVGEGGRVLRSRDGGSHWEGAP